MNTAQARPYAQTYMTIYYLQMKKAEKMNREKSVDEVKKSEASN